MKQDVQNQPVKKGNPYMEFLGVILIVLILNGLVFPKLTGQQIISTDYGTFIEKVDSGIVKEVMIKSNQIFFTAQENGGKTITFQTGEVNDPQLVDRLLKADSPNPDGKIAFNQIIPEENSPILNFLLMWILPGLIFYIIWHQTRKTIQSRMGAGGNFMSFGDSGAKIYADADIKTTFADVAGQEEAKDTLKEIVDFLHNPKKYTEIGASLPKGALLVGPPGTGKTLIARAVAGEAKVPFFAISGSEFVPMFVGMGAAKVRDLFKQATEKAPCIIFIDEIDAIGKKRDGAFAGNDEREQTLNQLLTEMDGFDGRKGVVILAATNRPESLDKALLRPGRFDRRIIVDKPDLKGRLETLKVHSKDVKMDESVDLDALALATAGLVGSDLANMINEAAINAVKNGRQLVNQSDLFEAFELVAVGGKEKKDRVMSDKERKIVSYHEVGHALVSALQKNTEPVQKITIVPRTMGALGYTLQTPEEEKYLETKDELLAKITTYMAGRAAEVLVFNSVTSGAANDIENATKIARAMVTMYGMSDKFGMMCLATVQNQYLEGGAGLICGENTASQIDDEVLSIINSSYAEAMKLLDENREILDSISDYLYEKETITGKEFMKMFRDMKGLPDPDEENKEQEATQNDDAQKDVTSATDPLLSNATDHINADTNESSGYIAPDDTSNN